MISSMRNSFGRARQFGNRSMSTEDIVKIAGTAVVGVGQTIALQKFVDTKFTIPLVDKIPFVGAQLAKPSVFAGVIGGGLATVLAVANMFGINVPFVPRIKTQEQYMLLGYGVPALASAIYTGFIAQPASSVPKSAVVRVSKVNPRAVGGQQNLINNSVAGNTMKGVL